MDVRIDNIDLYFFLTSQLLWRYYPNVWVRYHLFSRKRKPLVANRAFKDRWENNLRALSSQRFPKKTAQFLGEMHPLLQSDYLDWLVEHYRINASAVETYLNEDQFDVYWEAPACVAPLYEATFLAKTTGLRGDMEGLTPKPGWEKQVKEFGEYIAKHRINIVQAGLRRQRSYEVAKKATEILLDTAKDYVRSISDVRLARELGYYCSGTIPHYLIQVLAALDGYGEGNISTMYHWSNMYLVGKGQEAIKRYGAFLPDTFKSKVGMDSLVEFYRRYPDRRGIFAGLREDSMGTEKFVPFVDAYNHEHNLGITTIVPSNGLTMETAHVAKDIVTSAGYNCTELIGTFITHDLTGHPGIDLVAKVEQVWRVDEVGRSGPRKNVCKIGDGGKTSGPQDAVEEAFRVLNLNFER